MAVTAVVVAGCGGGPTKADITNAQEVLEAYGRAYAAHDGQAGCRLLTTEMRARYESRRQCLPSGVCTFDLGRRAQAPTQERDGYRRAQGGLGGIVEFSAANGPGMGGEVHLTKSGERWLLERDLLCITPSCDP